MKKRDILAITMLGSLILLAFDFQKGDSVLIEEYFNGRNTTDFLKTHKQNIELIVPKGSVGKINDILFLKKSKSYGLQITLQNGTHKGKTVWVYYNTHLADPGIILCRNAEGACETTKVPKVARTAQITKETKALGKKENQPSPEPTPAFPPDFTKAVESATNGIATGSCQQCAPQENPPASQPPTQTLRPETSIITSPASPPKLECSADPAFNLAEAQRNYDAAFPEYKAVPPLVKSQNFGSLTLQGTEQELQFLKLSLGSDTSLPALYYGTDCRTVVCFVSKVLNSEESARRVLTIFKKYGQAMSLSLNAIDSNGTKDPVWKPSQIRAINHVMDQLPESFFLPKIQAIRLVTAQSKVSEGTQATLSGNEIGLFQGDAGKCDTAYIPCNLLVAEGLSEAKLSEVFAHEFAHAYDFAHDDPSRERVFSDHSGFLKLSGWDRGTLVGDNTLTHKPATYNNFVSEYAKNYNYMEDFAETVSYYVNNPKELLKKSPEKYLFIKDKVFNGREVQLCKPRH